MSRLLPLALLLVLGLLLASAIRPVWTIDPDASLYVSLARSLAGGEGYALDGVPHTKYPPGLPLALSGVVRVAGEEAYAGFHALLVTALLGAVVLSGLLVRRLGYPDEIALAVAAGTALSQTLFDLSVTYVRTEALFLLLTLAALLAMWRALDPGRSRWTVVAAAALVVAAMSVRLAGVALLAVPALHLVRRGSTSRRRAALLLLIGATALGAWLWRSSEVARAFPEATDYGAEFRAAEPRDLTKIVRVDMPPLDAAAFVRRVAGNLDVLARATAVLITNVDRAGARLPVGLLLLALVLLGLHVMWWKPQGHGERQDAVEYVAASIGLCLIWPFNQQERFYVPLLPLLLLAAGEGLVQCLRTGLALASRPFGRLALLTAGTALLLILAAQRSDHPDLLGRWSFSYAGLLVAFVISGIVAWRLLARGVVPPRWWALVLVLPIAVPFLHRRCVEWPQQVDAFELRGTLHPESGALAKIDVDPRLEQVAVFLRDRTDPDTVVMTDVPRMLQLMSGRRCVPFVYRVHPPAVLTGGADLVFYSREIPEAAQVMDAVAGQFEPVFELAPVDDGGQLIIPAVHRPR